MNDASQSPWYRRPRWWGVAVGIVLSITDTLLATMKGNSNDVVVLTTQTDGPNECNENGALGVLAAATYLSKLESRRKTYVFSLPTGHYAGGPVSDNVTGSGRRAGTRGVMEKWPDVFKRTVAQIQLEQMAASEWAVVDGKWQATGRPAQEHWIPTPSVAQTMNRPGGSVIDAIVCGLLPTARSMGPSSRPA